MTGGASGLGLATARALAEAGARVVALDLNVGTSEPGILQLACDVAGDASVIAALDAAKRAHGPARIVVNCAGIAGSMRLVGRDGPVAMARFRAPAGQNPEQTIHDGEGKAQSYRQFQARISQLAAALNRLGLGYGATIAVMDWDTPRYLECFFAIPMIGATLHAVNIRLSPEQVLFPINHAEDDAILCHADFLPLLLPLLPRIKRPARLIFLTDVPAPLPDGFDGEYETLLAIGNGGRAPDGTQLLHPDLVAGLTASADYGLAFWRDEGTGTVVPYLSGAGGNRVLALPNGMVIVILGRDSYNASISDEAQTSLIAAALALTPL